MSHPVGSGVIERSTRRAIARRERTPSGRAQESASDDWVGLPRYPGISGMLTVCLVFRRYVRSMSNCQDLWDAKIQASGLLIDVDA